MNISEISRNHSNWKDTFAGRELGSSSGGWCIKNPIIFGSNRTNHEVANILIILYYTYTKQFPPSKSSPPGKQSLHASKLRMQVDIGWRVLMQSWPFPQGNNMRHFFHQLGSIDHGHVWTGSAQIRTWFEWNLLRLETAPERLQVRAKGAYISPNPVSVVTEGQKDEDSWRMTRILHKNLSRFIQILDMLWHASCSATWASRNAESNSRLSLSRTWINAGRCASARPCSHEMECDLGFCRANDMQCGQVKTPVPVTQNWLVVQPSETSFGWNLEDKHWNFKV